MPIFFLEDMATEIVMRVDKLVKPTPSVANEARQEMEQALLEQIVPSQASRDFQVDESVIACQSLSLHQILPIYFH